jgi:hypothetical protein
MTDNADFDLWGVLGESWWNENGRLCRCSARQIKFAAALHAKCTQYRAANLAGYPGDPNTTEGKEQLRSQGSRAAASDRVRDLLTLAEAQDSGAASEDLITAGEIDRRLSRMIRAPDPGTSLKATELWHRLEERKRERTAAAGGPSDPLESCSELLATYGLLAAPIACGTYVAAGGLVTCTPHFPLMASFLKRAFPSDWASWRKPLVARAELDPGAQRELAEFDALGERPELTNEDFMAAVGATAPKKRGNGHASEFMEAASAGS